MESILYNYSDIDIITTLLIEDIECFFEKEKGYYYQLNEQMDFEIDRIHMDINIGKINTKFFYKLSAKNFWYYEPYVSNSNSVTLFESGYFHTVLEILEHIKDVKENYHFFDNILCSSKQKGKLIKLKRSLAFFPQKEEKECSICYEPTKQVTLCNHPICLQCRESCILLQKKNCPICRGSKLYFYPYDPRFVL
jgi:hypothetical protein